MHQLAQNPVDQVYIQGTGCRTGRSMHPSKPSTRHLKRQLKCERSKKLPKLEQILEDPTLQIRGLDIIATLRCLQGGRCCNPYYYHRILVETCHSFVHHCCESFFFFFFSSVSVFSPLLTYSWAVFLGLMCFMMRNQFRWDQRCSLLFPDVAWPFATPGLPVSAVLGTGMLAVPFCNYTAFIQL